MAELKKGEQSMIDRRSFIAAGLSLGLATGSVRALTGEGSKPMEKRKKRLIDVHTHFIPDFYRDAAVAAGHEHPDGMPVIPHWSEEDMLDYMDQMSIRSAVISITSPGVHFGDDDAARILARRTNDFASNFASRHPARIGFFASTPLPDVEGAIAEAAHALDTLGADGIIIESNHHGMYPGDPAMEPFLAELDRRGAVLFIHPTSPDCPCCSKQSPMLPRPFLEFMFETTRAVTSYILSGAARRYPNIRIIIPHAGATLPVLADRIVGAAMLLPGLKASPQDVMDALGRFNYDLAGTPVPRQLPALRTFANPDRILFGSDWPFTPMPAVAFGMQRLDAFLAAEPDFLEAIERKNALNLFPKFATEAEI